MPPGGAVNSSAIAIWTAETPITTAILYTSYVTLPPLFAPAFPATGVWRRVFRILYTSLALTCFGFGRMEFALAYLVIAGFFSLTSIGFDWFTPVTVAMHAFGLYFLAVMAFQRDMLPSTLHYIVLTLAIFAFGYILIPKLNLAYFRAMTSCLALRRDMRGKAVLMQAIGIVMFLISTGMAGFSNPLKVFSAPLQYRYYMMVGGMAYLRLLIDLFVNTPVLIVVLAYYKGKVKCGWPILFCITGLIYALASGSRANVMSLVIEVLILRHILRKHLSAKMVLVTIALFLPFVAIMGEYRNVKSINENIEIGDVVRALDLRDMATLALSRFDASYMFNELMARRSTIPASLGLSYAEVPLQAIPRSWWPEKPRMPNPAMTRMIGKDDGMSDVAFDFGIFGETLINFQWVGCAVGAIILIGVIGPLQSIFERALLQREVMDIFICSLCWFIPFVVIVSGLVEATVTTASTVLYLLVIRVVFLRRDYGSPTATA